MDHRCSPTWCWRDGGGNTLPTEHLVYLDTFRVHKDRTYQRLSRGPSDAITQPLCPLSPITTRTIPSSAVNSTSVSASTHACHPFLFLPLHSPVPYPRRISSLCCRILSYHPGLALRILSFHFQPPPSSSAGPELSLVYQTPPHQISEFRFIHLTSKTHNNRILLKNTSRE